MSAASPAPTSSTSELDYMIEVRLAPRPGLVAHIVKAEEPVLLEPSRGGTGPSTQTTHGPPVQQID